MEQIDKEMIVDTYLRETAGLLGTLPNQVEPTGNFKTRVMREVLGCERQRGIVRLYFFAIIAMSPFVFRMIWSVLRHDYFSISHMPFGHWIYIAYQAFLSSTGAYLMLGVGITGGAYVLWRGWQRIHGQISKVRMA